MEYSEYLLELFRQKGALLEGHFLLSSGLHSPNYLQCAKVLQYPSIAAELGTGIARHITGADLVLSPAMGGIIIGHEVASSLNVPFIFCEREEKEFKLRRGFRIERKQKIAVIEDVVTTGRSTKETIALAEREGAKIIGVGSIVDRSIEKIDFPAPFYSLLRFPLSTYDPVVCPLCKANVPIVKPGSRPV